MSVLNDFKVTDKKIDGTDVSISALPNKPNEAGMTASELKLRFDMLAYSLVGLKKLNGLIDFLGSSGADDLGVSEVEGLTATKVKDALSELLSKITDNASNITAIKGAGWTTENLVALKNELEQVEGNGWTSATNLMSLLASFTSLNNELKTVEGTGWTSATTLMTLLSAINAAKGAGWTNENLVALNTELKKVEGTGWTDATTLMGLLGVINTIKGAGWTDESLTSLSALISANASNIATNATNIATNANNIATNTQNISTNANNITALDTALNTHKSSGDHDARYLLNTQKGAANGLASLDASGFLEQSQIPPITKISFTSVTTHAQMLALTISQVQNGDVIEVTNEEGQWYMVVDDTKLGTNNAFRALPKGIISVALSAQKYDNAFHGEYSIKDALDGKQGNLSSAQLNAVNSGITSGKVSTYDGYATGKQNTLSGTQLGAVNSGITSTKVGTYDGYATNKQDTLSATQLNAVNSGITSGKVSTYDGYATGKQDSLSTAQLNAANSGITSAKVSTYDGYATSKQTKFTSLTITLASGGWGGASAPYTQTVSVSGMTTAKNVHAKCVYSSTLSTALAEKEDFGKISDATQGSGTITFTCFEEKPTNNLTLQLEVWE